MTDLRSLDARLEQDATRSMPSAGINHGTEVEPGAASRDEEITRLREENERLRKGLREISQLLDPPVQSRPGAPPKVCPTIWLL